MATYEYTGNTERLGVAAANNVVAFKVDLAGDPVISILDQGQADGAGDFTLSWLDWSGRVMIGAFLENEAAKINCKVYDYQAGVLV